MTFFGELGVNKGWRTKLLLSFLGTFAFIGLGIIATMKDHSGWGGLFFFIIGSIYSVGIALIETIIFFYKKEYAPSIFYLSSCLLNLLFTILLILSYSTQNIFAEYANFFLFLILVFIGLGFIQLFILVKLFKEHKHI